MFNEQSRRKKIKTQKERKDNPPERKKCFNNNYRNDMITNSNNSYAVLIMKECFVKDRVEGFRSTVH